MRANNYDFIPLKWDSDYFGVSCARVNLTGTINKLEKEDIIKLCNAYDFVTISNLDNNKLNNHWIGIETNAFLVDMNIQFIKELTCRKEYKKSNGYIVNNFPGNEQLLDIAKRSFKYSRFFNDPKLPVEKASLIYNIWTEGAFEKEDKFFVINEKDGVISGFILFRIDGDCGIIELISVDEKYQKQNIGKTLIESMECFLFERQIYKIKVGTQADNISAMKFYIRVGFRIVSCNSIYHLWK